MSDLLREHTGEGYKGGLHLAMFGLAAMFTGYNLGALLVRPEKRLAFNAAVYLALMALETKQVHQHWSQS